jgi:hypothetical protein
MLGVLTTPVEEEATVTDGISNKQFVGVDLHLHRSVICPSSPGALLAEVARISGVCLAERNLRKGGVYRSCFARGGTSLSA